MTERLDAWAPQMRSVLRIIAGLLFMAHGTMKHLGFPPAAGPSAEAWSLGWIAGLFELVGGALLALGLFTRPVAFVISGVMAFAYFIAHAPRSFYPLLNNGDAAILYSFIFLYLFAAGGGRLSLDKMLGLSKD
jgi:putative oxidoreductase